MNGNYAGHDDTDILIVGSGVSGINAAGRIQQLLPSLSYKILEARHEAGGTWSLFKFPGIRSDSDLYTFGFPWEPWSENRPIADGASILNYIKRAAEKHGIDKHIRYAHKVTKMDWSSKQQRWTVHVSVGDSAKTTYTARFVFMGTGLYDYQQGLKSTIPEIQNFQGTVVHPQFWPEDLDYDDKRIAIIGSGATAVTLLPSLTEKAAHVTMIQRSPGYYYSTPARNLIDDLIRRWFPSTWVHHLLRWKYIVGFFAMYEFATRMPEATKRRLRKDVEPQLPANIPYEPHFVPSYNPWEQRLCVTPQGDFFRALRTGRSDIVTDHITTVDETGIVLKSGRRIDADIIVTATGLQMELFGKVSISVDGEPIDHSTKFAWRGSWLQDVPNLAFAFGYTNASWTLGADVSTLLFVRMVEEIGKREKTYAMPMLDQPLDVEEVPWLNLNSSYIQKAAQEKKLPKAGNVAPWKPRSSFIQESLLNKWIDVTAGMAFGPVNA